MVVTLGVALIEIQIFYLADIPFTFYYAAMVFSTLGSDDAEMLVIEPCIGELQLAEYSADLGPCSLIHEKLIGLGMSEV